MVESTGGDPQAVAEAWEVHVQLRLVAPRPDADMRALCDALTESIDDVYEFLPSADSTGSGPPLTFTTAGGVFQVEATSPGQAVDVAVTQARQAIQAAGAEVKGVAEIMVLPGDVDPRTI